MPTITSLTAREILDSRGTPTIEVDCVLGSGASGRASVPSGASTGKHEAMELRDADATRYNGRGVLKVVSNVNEEISRNICGKELDQKGLDDALISLDGTENKSRLGANAILGVSLAFARAASVEMKVELFEYIGKQDSKLPQPMLNVINGGKHADSGLDIQEFMIVPVGFDTFRRKIQAAEEIITALKNILSEKGYAISVGDEGGFAPKLSSNEEALEILVQAIKSAGYSDEEVRIALDVAATSFYKDGKYQIKINSKEESRDAHGMINWYESLTKKFPIISIEDGLSEDDWDGFMEMNSLLGNKIRIVGDDLTVTNVLRIQNAVEKKAINSVIIKPNQIGTLTETIAAVELARKNGLTAIASHRSGETTDTFIADLAVGLSCEYIKAGSLTRGERVCKYDRLMEIEDLLK